MTHTLIETASPACGAKLLSIEDPADIDTHLTVGSGQAHSIVHKATSHDVFAPLKD
jgi:hypothetical protein